MRAFLIGNGPSLRETPLHLISHELSIGCNKIAKIFPHTTWRPSHYLKMDHSPFDQDSYRDQIYPMVGSHMLLWDAFRDGDKSQEIEGLGDLPYTQWVKRCKHHAYIFPHDKASQTWHLPTFCTGINSINLMAQWAVSLGADEIYLVGCDGNFTDGKNDHFMENYYQTVDSGYEERNNLQLSYAHTIIKRSCPVPVYNATIGGNIEIYPRVDLRKL